MFYCRCVRIIVIFAAMCFFNFGSVNAEYSSTNSSGNSGNFMPGIPLGGDVEGVTNADLCPIGISVISSFLEAWKSNDYTAMYGLLDDSCKSEYTLEQATMDFRLMDYKVYKISSVRESGENFEFVLSHGDWKTGNKELQKMLVNGKTFRIMMPSRNSVFKRSVADYF